MNYTKIIPNDLVNGEGARVSLFVSGCDFKCPGCFNKAQQEYDYGFKWDKYAEEKLWMYLNQKHVKGLSLLGGEPLSPKNRDTVLYICEVVSALYPEKDIWLWTGYTYEEVEKEFPAILEFIDVMVDGRFVKELKDPSLKWRGSSNQRVIRINNV